MLLGASLSVVNSATWPPTRFSASLMVFGIDRAHHDAGDARRDEVVHHAGLDRGRRLLGILEGQVVVRQLGLGLLDAGFGGLPEVGRAVDDEGELLLALSLGCAAQCSERQNRGGGQQ